MFTGGAVSFECDNTLCIKWGDCVAFGHSGIQALVIVLVCQIFSVGCPSNSSMSLVVDEGSCSSYPMSGANLCGPVNIWGLYNGQSRYYQVCGDNSTCQNDDGIPQCQCDSGYYANYSDFSDTNSKFCCLACPSNCPNCTSNAPGASGYSCPNNSCTATNTYYLKGHCVSLEECYSANGTTQTGTYGTCTLCPENQFANNNQCLSTSSNKILYEISQFFNNSCVGTIQQNLTSGVELCIAANQAVSANKDALGHTYSGQASYYQTEALYTVIGKAGYKKIPYNPQKTVWYLTLNGALISNETMMNADTAIIVYDSSRQQMTSYYYSSFSQNQYQVASSSVTASNVQESAQEILSGLVQRIKNMPKRYSTAVEQYFNAIANASKDCRFVYKLGDADYCSYLTLSAGPVNNNTGVITTLYPPLSTEYQLFAYTENNLTYSPNNHVWYYTSNAQYGPQYDYISRDFMYYVFNPDIVTLSEWYYSQGLDSSMPIVRGFPIQPLPNQSVQSPAGIAIVTVGTVALGALITVNVVNAVYTSTTVTSVNAVVEAAVQANIAAADSGVDIPIGVSDYISTFGISSLPSAAIGETGVAAVQTAQQAVAEGQRNAEEGETIMEIVDDVLDTGEGTDL